MSDGERPDSHPDSAPSGPSEAPDQLSPADPGRSDVERDTPGSEGGTTGHRRDDPRAGPLA